MAPSLSLLVSAASAIVPRRALVASVATAALVRPSASIADSSTFKTQLTAQLETLLNTNKDSVLDEINALIDFAADYGGMPTPAYRQQFVQAVLSKRAQLRATGGWDNEKEEQYLRLQRIVDPWRVVELQPAASGAVLAFAPVYIALLAVGFSPSSYSHY